MTRKIIFDTDPGVDDSLALLLLARLKDAELLGVTTVFGNADLKTVTNNALYMREVFGFDAPIAAGAGKSFDGDDSLPPAHIHGHNGLGDIEVPEVDRKGLDPRPAHQFISDVVRANPGEVTIVAVGRMTNLALAIAHDPELPSLVKEVVIMGGAFQTQGNVTPIAEANIIGDAIAADLIFTAPWHVVAVGLDVTRQTILPQDELDHWAETTGDAGLKLVADASRLYVGYHERFGVKGCYIHDSSAVAYAFQPELFELSHGPIRVVRDGIAVGQTIQRDPATPFPPGAWDDQPEQAAAMGVDAEALIGWMKKTLVG